jgi:hypothetical protein
LRPSPVLDVEAFRALCKKVGDEKDPVKIEILKERMRTLLANRDRDTAHHPDVFVN